MKFMMKTTTTMKPYNKDKWWITSDLISQQVIEAENLTEALKKYQEICEDRFGVTISDTALKERNPMYVDIEGEPKQVGFVITASTEFDAEEKGWVRNYIELWVEILTVIDTKF